MRIGVPKEIKQGEYRVGLTPDSVAVLVKQGHQVAVQSGAGEGIHRSDEFYRRAGAEIMLDSSELYHQAELLVKVKEPLPEECRLLRPGQILFCFLHLAANPDLVPALLASGVTAIAYETVENQAGALPILAPMSQIAGRVAIQSGAHHLEKQQGGAGILLSGAQGVNAGKVVIIGAGVAGFNAAQMALGLGARVTVLDVSQAQLDKLAARLAAEPGIDGLLCEISTPEAIYQQVLNADLVVGCVLVPGASAPKVISRSMVAAMRAGTIIVDIAIDQGGCVETSRPTSHLSPTYVKQGVIHFCVSNIPGAVPATASYALNNAVLPYVQAIANRGLRHAIEADSGLSGGVNLCRGLVTHPVIADAMGVEEVVSPLSAILQANS